MAWISSRRTTMITLRSKLHKAQIELIRLTSTSPICFHRKCPFTKDKPQRRDNKLTFFWFLSLPKWKSPLFTLPLRLNKDFLNWGKLYWLYMTQSDYCPYSIFLLALQSKVCFIDVVLMCHSYLSEGYVRPLSVTVCFT